MQFKEFFDQNRSYCIAFLVVAVLCLGGAWVYADYCRNQPIYTDTDHTMADLENRIGRIESGLDRLQNRIEQSEKTLTGIADAVARSGKLANKVASGIAGSEDRIDQAIQRSGRIQNLIADIENANRTGTENTPQAGLAK